MRNWNKVDLQAAGKSNRQKYSQRLLKAHACKIEGCHLDRVHADVVQTTLLAALGLQVWLC